MSLPIYVETYSGHKLNERPRQFTLDEEIYEINVVLDQWYEPSLTYFKVQSTEGKTYPLRYDEEADEWTLQSGFDADELLARPSIQLVTVDSAIAKTAEQQIESCKHCHPVAARIPFDWLLAEVTGKRGPYELTVRSFRQWGSVEAGAVAPTGLGNSALPSRPNTSSRGFMGEGVPPPTPGLSVPPEPPISAMY